MTTSRTRRAPLTSAFLLLAAAPFLNSSADAQVLLAEDFDGGGFPPAGWTVVDSIGNGSWRANSTFGVDNTTGGSGDCAAMNSFHYGSIPVDGELLTPPFDVPASGCLLEFKHFFWYWPQGGLEIGDVDIRTGSGPWSNLRRYMLGDFQGIERVDLGAFAGASGVQVRFRYYNAWYDWWWQIDDALIHVPEPRVPVWLEDFDGGTFPPSGWSVVDNTGKGGWKKSSDFPRGNMVGEGEAAALDSDYYGSVGIDGELISAPFDVPDHNAHLEFDHFFLARPGGGVEVCDVDLRVGGGSWTNLARFTTTVAGREVIDLTGYGGVTGVQIRFRYHNALGAWWWQVDDVGVFLREPGTRYCPGDGAGTPCPCGNDNDGGPGGCDWGDPAFPGGGLLSAIGSTSVASGDLRLVATDVESDFGLFFAGHHRVNGGDGFLLFDGLRCAGGGVVRLAPPTVATGNQLTLPAPLQQLDPAAAAGGTRRYQYWFRTPVGSCSLGANLTNGYEVLWTP